MVKVYPVVLRPASSGGYVAHVPTLELDTQGETLAEAIAMSRDAIGLWGICREDLGEPIPDASELSPAHDPQELVALVDVDFTAYRRANNSRSVRRNVSLPSWLNDAADKAGLNCSAILQAALKQELRLDVSP